ncbi:MAG: PEGA domain-containing protein [Fibrobacteria bacterium]
MNPNLPPNPSGANGAGPDGSGERMRLFENLLRQDVEIRADFAKLENALFERIQKAGSLGPFALLKAEESPPAGFFDKVEADLFARIQNHREYDQPVNDIIASAVKPSEMELRRIEGRLDGRLDEAAHLEPWEQYLKADVPLPMGRSEAVEEKLLTRIERHRKLEEVAPASLWLSLGLFLRQPAAKIAAGFVLGVAVLLGGVRLSRQAEPALETYVYQAQGSSVGDLSTAFPQGRPAIHGTSDIQSKDDGAMILVNQRGFVEMRNGSSLRIEKADRKQMGYRVGFAGHGRTARGNVTFFVNKRKGAEKYQVTTPDYRIEVLGTYFRVNPDLGGRISTSVLEGKVKIHSDGYGEFEVAAGQSLVYDAVMERYRVQDGGSSVRREDIETVPAAEELEQFGVLTVTSGPRSGVEGHAGAADGAGAEVRIDGKYKGATPLVVLLPPGRHEVRLSLEGRSAVDTAVVLGNGSALRLTVAMPRLPVNVPKNAFGNNAKAPAKAANAATGANGAAMIAEKAAAEAGSPLPISQLSRAEEADLLYRKADAAPPGEWQNAVALYLEVLENPGSKPLRKEAAFFSIARLRADHEKEKSQAKEDFLRYLALYPDGAFSGESWLRLAELEVGRNHDKAIEYYQRAIENLPRHPRLSEMQHRVGLLYLQDKRYDEAVAMFRQSLGNILYANESEKRKIYQSLYRTLVAKGDRKSANLIDQAYRPPEDSISGK